ncbi:hypothetical protein J4221_05860 [Candidatus Pacearchaeota archaeon]|nr:hypothetical protein [Candidatus Pacearchaeota archaeon]
MSISLEQFNPLTKKDFRVESGKIIIADPFTLGYSSRLEQKLKNITKSNRHPFIPLSHGVLCRTLSKDNYPVNGRYAVYKKNKLLRIQRNDNLVSLSHLIDKFGNRFSDYDSFDEFKEDYLCSEDERLVSDKTTLHLLQNPLFEVDFNNYCLLIGDAEYYSVPEFELTNTESYERLYNHERESYYFIREVYDDQVLYLPRGDYTFRSSLKDEMIVLEKI